jgi:hypothetical protein
MRAASALRWGVMSKERARRRAEREREAAIRAAARASEAERRERHEARKRALRRMTPTWTPRGKQTGPLARRARTRTSLLLAALLAVNVRWRSAGPARAAGRAALTLLVLPALVRAPALTAGRGRTPDLAPGRRGRDGNADNGMSRRPPRPRRSTRSTTGWPRRNAAIYGHVRGARRTAGSSASPEGGQGYDVMGYSHTQLIDDVLDQYERHLEFLRLNAGSPA